VRCKNVLDITQRVVHLFVLLVVAVLPGEDFTLDVHSIIFGKAGRQERTTFYGNMRNFYFNGERLFDHMPSDPTDPLTTIPTDRHKWKEFDGYWWVMYDLGLLPESYLERNFNEEFDLIFRTSRADGLIWYTGNDQNNMHLSMKVYVL